MSPKTNIIDQLKIMDAKGFTVAEKAMIYEIAERIAAYDLSSIQSINKPNDAVRLLQNRYRSLDHEIFGVIFLDNKHKVVSIDEIFSGTIDGAAVYPREVVKKCIACSACACIFFHNHPSGDALPSGADKKITRRLKDALALIDVNVLDHFIVSGHAYHSFAEAGEL